MKNRFTGPMGILMKQHLELRRSMGFILKGAEYNLDEFDRYLSVHFPTTRTISRSMVIKYLGTVKHKHPKSQSDRVTSLRQFARYLFQFEPSVYIPERSLTPKAITTVKPHIYSESEIQLLIQAANTMSVVRSPMVPHTYAAVIGLLWVSGLRIGEAMKLNLEDVDLEAGVLTIRQTKFFKSRLVPLSPSSMAALSKYKKLRLEQWPYQVEPDTPFFINRDGVRCDKSTTGKEIHGLIRKLGFRTVQGRYPRVHDIRHSFATHSLASFYQDGKDPSALLPVLATFLGHSNIANTQVYLHPSVALLQKAGCQFHRYISKEGGGT